MSPLSTPARSRQPVKNKPGCLCTGYVKELTLSPGRRGGSGGGSGPGFRGFNGGGEAERRGAFVERAGRSGEGGTTPSFIWIINACGRSPPPAWGKRIVASGGRRGEAQIQYSGAKEGGG